MDPSAAHTTCTSDAITPCAQPPEPTESEPSPIPPSPKEGQMSPEQRTFDDDGGLQPSEEEFRLQKLLEANSKDNHGYRRIIRNFTPSWFSVNMGTGIVSILLHNLPYNGVWLYWISVVIFVLNVTLFILFSFISLLRYILYPQIWTAMLKHPTQSLFLGTFPMGLATIVNMVVFVCVPAWGPRAITLAWALWWIDAALSVATCFYLPFVMFVNDFLALCPVLHKLGKTEFPHSMYFHDTKLKSMTAAWLLPVVSTIVAAASGGIIADVLPNPSRALWTLTASYILWGTGVPLAMAILVIYFQRLTVHSLPPREVIVSVFLPLGPMGQGGFAIMQLGAVAMKVFPVTGTLSARTTNAGEILYVVGWMIALIMWGFGLVWLFFALASTSRNKFPFNIGWWGFTFPLGVFAVSTTQIGKEMPSRFFDVLGTGFSVSVTLLWIVVATGTLRKALAGEIFFAPCLKDLEGKEKQWAKQYGEELV